MRGIMTVYVKAASDSEAERSIDLFKQVNKALIESVEKEGYGFMVVPTVNESARIEKVDFDMPHPRILSPYHVDIGEIEKRRAQRNALRAAETQRKIDAVNAEGNKL